MGGEVESKGEGEGGQRPGSRRPRKRGGERWCGLLRLGSRRRHGGGGGGGSGVGVVVVGRDEVRDGGVEAAGEVVGQAGGEAPPRGESHGGGGAGRSRGGGEREARSGGGGEKGRREG